LSALTLVSGCGLVGGATTISADVPNQMTVTSQVFNPHVFPSAYTCDGAGHSPSLHWSGAPQGTKSLALLVDDASAPIRPYIYWILFDIGSQTTGIQAGQVPPGARQADNSKDNPDAQCLPMGIMQMDAHPYPKKVIQTPTEVLMIYEASGTTVREIFLDGRPLPKKDDVEPWFNGYSVGHWDGDTLVVETTGLMDDGWLDVRGSPLTSAATLTERIRRINFGYLEIKVTVDDPKAYTKPFDAIIYSRIMTSSQLSEFVCIEKDAKHYVGGQPPPAAPAQK